MDVLSTRTLHAMSPESGSFFAATSTGRSRPTATARRSRPFPSCGSGVVRVMPVPLYDRLRPAATAWSAHRAAGALLGLGLAHAALQAREQLARLRRGQRERLAGQGAEAVPGGAALRRAGQVAPALIPGRRSAPTAGRVPPRPESAREQRAQP